jgi:hypothetical protein
LEHLRRRAVARDLQRISQRVFALLVLTARHPSARRDRRIEISQHRSWRVAALQRCRVNDRLESRTCLTARLRGAVVGALVEVASADQREDVAGVRIHRDQTTLQILGFGTALHDLLDA